MTEVDNLEDIPADKSPVDGFEDFQGAFPLRQYAGKQSTNLEARGIEENKIPYGGGDKGINLELLDQTSSEYPFNQVRRTIAGHVTEFDDTPGREKILIKHKSGTGLEFQPDGTILLYSSKNTVRVTAGDEKVIIEGDGDVTYHGNLKLRVDGNFDLDVGGDFNVTTHGDKLEDIKGGIRQDVNGNIQSLINGNVTTQITRNETRVVHGDQDYFIKGNKSNLVQGVLENLSKDVMRMTSESQAVMSSPDINIGATSLSVFGAAGTIGGDQIVYYGTTAHIDRVNSTSMHAPTFHGDLTGRADEAIASDTAIYASYGGGPGGPAGWTNTNTTATNVTTTEFTTELSEDYLAKHEHAVREVLIDPGALLYNQINRDADYGGVSDRTLTTAEVRSKLRDPLNQQNETFIGAILSEGLMHHSFSNAAPNDIDRIEGREATVRRAQSKKVLGKNPGGETKRFKGSVRDGLRKVSISAVYKPDNKVITSRTELAQGVVIGRFLGGYGDAVTFDHVIDNTKKVTIARNLLLNANANRSIMVNSDVYSEHRLVVAEGIYRKYANEGMTSLGVNDLKSKGRCVVYELHDRTGNIDLNKTFDLASWWKDSLQFEKLILSYDTFNPQGGALTAQIILIMPELKPDYTATFNNLIETRYNNFVQSTNEIVECL
jgi:hypothetical protein